MSENFFITWNYLYTCSVTMISFGRENIFDNYQKFLNLLNSYFRSSRELLLLWWSWTPPRTAWPMPRTWGSVVQLSASSQALLVSTEERAFLVDIKTHKLDQVGRKDRKAGPYGGFFVQDGSRAYVARPGLRLWVADSVGKVSECASVFL